MARFSSPPRYEPHAEEVRPIPHVLRMEAHGVLPGLSPQLGAPPVGGHVPPQAGDAARAKNSSRMKPAVRLVRRVMPFPFPFRALLSMEHRSLASTMTAARSWHPRAGERPRAPPAIGSTYYGPPTCCRGATFGVVKVSFQKYALAPPDR
jgi:hypothetical protein